MVAARSNQGRLMGVPDGSDYIAFAGGSGHAGDLCIVADGVSVSGNPGYSNPALRVKPERAALAESLAADLAHAIWTGDPFRASKLRHSLSLLQPVTTGELAA